MSFWKNESGEAWTYCIPMRVVRIQKQTKPSQLLLGTLGIVGIGLLIAGGVLSNPILLGAGFAGLVFACGGCISSKTTLSRGVV
jgi:hypothetical protein